MQGIKRYYIYVKSLCLVDEESTQEEAQVNCLKNGMRLFKTDTDESREALLDYANEKWQVEDDLFTPHIDGITKSLSTPTEAPKCKRLEKIGGSFAENNKADCADGSQSICEFINEKPN